MIQFLLKGFNPYFSGSVTGTQLHFEYHSLPVRFNPYFSGSVTGTLYIINLLSIFFYVSILILVDQSLEQI